MSVGSNMDLGEHGIGQKGTVRTVNGTTDWFHMGKGDSQGCILSPCLFNAYAEYIMRNAGPEEAYAGIKIAGRNVQTSGNLDSILNDQPG